MTQRETTVRNRLETVIIHGTKILNSRTMTNGDIKKINSITATKNMAYTPAVTTGV